jgi:hypothetical protein
VVAGGRVCLGRARTPGPGQSGQPQTGLLRVEGGGGARACEWSGTTAGGRDAARARARVRPPTTTTTTATHHHHHHRHPRPPLTFVVDDRVQLV